MENQSRSVADRYGIEAGPVPWESLESRTATAFTLGGSLLIASVVVPIGLGTVTEWSWASGLVLVGLGVVATVAGLLGTYPQVGNLAPRLARLGALSATVAGGAALGLTVAVAAAVVAVVTLGASLPKPMGVFGAVALSMAGGLALGYVLFGAARVRTGGRSDTPGRLLVAGGALLLLPVVGELLRIGLPPWVLFPALGVVALDTLAIGRSLRSAPSR